MMAGGCGGREELRCDMVAMEVSVKRMSERKRR